MEFPLYCENEDAFLEVSPNSKNSWTIASDSSMDNEEYFGWGDALKDDAGKFGDRSETKKRKSVDETKEMKRPKQQNVGKSMLDGKSGVLQKASSQNDGVRMFSQWQTDDMTDLNADIDGSLGSLNSPSYNMSDAILTLSGLTVFKQELPSPTSQEANIQTVRRFNQSPSSTQDVQRNNVDDSQSDQTIINNTINQLLSHTAYTNLQNALDVTLTGSSSSQDSFNVTSTNFNLIEDFRFQYVLAAATSIATKLNEDTLTYLNQGQSYEIKLKKLGDLSHYRGKMLRSVIRICFHERRLQYMEKEQMSLWQRARPGDRILDVDIPLSYGAFDIIQPPKALNVVHFNWDPTKEVGIYIKVNCISTEFTPKKHGGEKGVPFRIQVETYPAGEAEESKQRLHAAACQIKVFKLKGADRKHKQDRDKIMKRPRLEQEKFQPSYECTVLNDIPDEAVLSSSPPTLLLSQPDSGNSDKASPVNVIQRNTGKVALPSLSPTSNTYQTHESMPEAKIEPLQVEQEITTENTPAETNAWLANNRFEKYISTFSSFSGADMIRLCRNDLIQICGQVDGIRLYNALHSRINEPKLKLYVRQLDSKVFNAVFLTKYSNDELTRKLCSISSIPFNKVRDVYVEGPQSIHVVLSNEYILHIKDDSTFSLEIIEEGDLYILLLKPLHVSVS